MLNCEDKQQIIESLQRDIDQHVFLAKEICIAQDCVDYVSPALDKISSHVELIRKVSDL